MSYVDEVIEQVVAQNPAEPEFHQAVKEVLESLRVVVEANEEAFRRDALFAIRHRRSNSQRTVLDSDQEEENEELDAITKQIVMERDWERLRQMTFYCY